MLKKVSVMLSAFSNQKPKDTFLKIVMNQNTYQLVGESGINIKKLDKACIVFNVNRDNGYKVCILDKTNTKKRRSTGQPIS